MITEIRRNVAPVYPYLTDDKSVHEMPDVPGMDVNTFFFSHHATETADDQMSKCNEPEAEMIVNFLRYLTHNHVEPEKITILTFYNGQRRLIDRKLRKSQLFHGKRIAVVTVDSYQGEENEILLLSMVRNNVGPPYLHFPMVKCLSFQNAMGTDLEYFRLTSTSASCSLRTELSLLCQERSVVSTSLVTHHSFASHLPYGGKFYR